MPQLSHTLSANETTENIKQVNSKSPKMYQNVASREGMRICVAGWISDPSKSNLQDFFLHYVSKQPVELGSSNTRWRLRFVPAMQALVSPRRSKWRF